MLCGEDVALNDVMFFYTSHDGIVCAKMLSESEQMKHACQYLSVGEALVDVGFEKLEKELSQ